MVLRLLEVLGITHDAPPTSKGTLHARLAAQLGRLGASRVEALTAFAGLLARAAFGDSNVSPAEKDAMAVCLREQAALRETDAELVADIACQAAEALNGVEDYLLTRAFNDHAGEAEKCALLECAYAVAAADGLITDAEDEEIKRIAKALLVPRTELLRIREPYRDRLAVLRDLPG